MAYNVNDVIKVAESEVGYLEKKNNSQLDDKTANAGHNNYTKYWRDLEPSFQGQPWCQAFLNWVFTKAYGEKVAKELLCTDSGWSYYTPTASGFFRNKGQYHKSNPKPGDLVYFKNSTRIHHVGLVYKVDSTKIYTIEGNTSSAAGVVDNGGGVFMKSYPIGYNRIDGYGRPNYGAESKESRYSMLFNPVFYAGVYTDIRKAFGSNKSYMEEHFLTHGMREGRMGSPVFDPKFYRDKNSDLKKAFGSNWVKYYDHFIDYGIKEGRASSFVFDIKTYRDSNSDLKKAFGSDNLKYVQHFIEYGINELRKSSPTFYGMAYKNNYPDLSSAFGKDGIQYFIHWYAHGAKEGRKCV